MPDLRSPEFPLLFLHDAARYLALRDLVQNTGPTPTRYATVAAQPTAAAQALAYNFLSALLQAAGLAAPEADTLTPRARAWLAQPLPLQLDTLRQAWWHTVAWEPQAWPALDFPHWLAGRWATVVTAVCRWLVQRSTGQWSAWADLERILAEQRLYTPSGIQGNLPRLQRVTRACVDSLARGLLLLALPALGLSEARRQAASWQVRPTAAGKRWLTVALERRQVHTAVAQELTVHWS